MVSKTHAKTRTRVRTRKVRPPIHAKDPRVLGAGSSKFAWKMYPTNQVAVINAFDSQILKNKPKNWKIKDWLAYYTEEMKQEYLFTDYLHKLFGTLIPRVFLFKEDFFLDRRFRYQKELCLPVEKGETLFHDMFTIEDYLLDQGWVYMDMKHANLGIRNETYCLVDTDPCHFYRIPDALVPYFRVAAYMVILLVTHYLPDEVLTKKMKDLGLDMETLEETYDFFASLTEDDLNELVVYGNTFLDEPFTLTKVVNPKDFMDAYGGGDPLSIFKHLTRVKLTPSRPKSGRTRARNSVMGTKGTGAKGTDANVKPTRRTNKPTVRQTIRAASGTKF